MRTFFYSVRATDCQRDCVWQTCSERYYSQLKAAKPEYDFLKLDNMVQVNVQLYPKWGDVIILFVSMQKDIEQFISQKERFEGLKRIIVVADPDNIRVEECHKFRPSYITNISQDIHEVTSVVEQIDRNVC